MPHEINLYRKAIEQREKKEMKQIESARQLNLEIEQMKPDQSNNRVLCGLKLTKELVNCAKTVMLDERLNESS